MKATEQCFSVVLFTMQYKVVLADKSMAIEMKATEQFSCGALHYAVQGGSSFQIWMRLKWIFKFDHWNESHWSQQYPVLLFIMLYKVVLDFESVDEILKCDHSNKSYWAVLSCGAVYYAVQGGSNFWVCGWNPKVWPFKWKLLSSTFLWCCLLCCTRWF